MKRSHIVVALVLLMVASGPTPAQRSFAQTPPLVEPPTTAPPPNDPLQTLDTSGRFHGTLVYVPYITLASLPQSQHYVVLRSVGGGAGGRGSATTYHAEDGSNYLFFPHISPDNRSLLLSVGTPFYLYSGYSLYLCDLKTRAVRGIDTRDLTFPVVRWSPTGQYLAVVHGGDAAGSVTGGMPPHSLWVDELRTGHSQQIIQNPAALDEVWTAQNELLFTVSHPAPARGGPALHQDVYEWNAAGGRPRLLIQGGVAPVPAPNGRQVAFFGWPVSAADTGAEKKVGDQFGLYVYDRETGRRILVGPGSYATLPADDLRSQAYGSLPTQISWTPDGKSLVVLTPHYRALGEPGPGEGTAEVSVIDVTRRSARALAVLRAEDTLVNTPSRYVPQFITSGVSNDGSWLFVKQSEVTGRVSSFYTQTLSLLAVSLKTGKVALVARISNRGGEVLGLDWRDSSLPTQMRAQHHLEGSAWRKGAPVSHSKKHF